MSTQPINTANKTKFPSLGGGTPLAPLGGAPPLPLERSCAVSGRLPPILACTRFNNKTWQEYQQWKNTYQQSYEQIYQRPLKCIYGCPREISDKKFPPQAKILVVEMNNDENKIMGIGEIINQTASEAYRSNNNKPQTTAAARVKFNIFSDRNYTRYIYIGNTYYASREELERNQTEDAQYINKQLKSAMPQTTQEIQIQSIERLLFKGSGHMKRGSGISKINTQGQCNSRVNPKHKISSKNIHYGLQGNMD
jgi:predicted transcriptional regulator